MMRYYVYVHRRADNGEVFYVGSAGEKVFSGPSKPFKRARDAALRRTSSWHNVVNDAHGFSYEIISEHKTDEEARAAELAAMDNYKSESLCNQRRQAIEWGDEKRLRHGRYGSAHGNFGRKLSKETCEQKSKSLLGDKHHLFGKELPSDWVAAIAAAKVGEKNPYYGKPTAVSKRVMNVMTGVVYASIYRAAKAEGIAPGKLYSILDGHTKINTTSLVRI